MTASWPSGRDRSELSKASPSTRIANTIAMPRCPDVQIQMPPNTNAVEWLTPWVYVLQHPTLAPLPRSIRPISDRIKTGQRLRRGSPVVRVGAGGEDDIPQRG